MYCISFNTKQNIPVSSFLNLLSLSPPFLLSTCPCPLFRAVTSLHTKQKTPFHFCSFVLSLFLTFFYFVLDFVQSFLLMQSITHLFNFCTFFRSPFFPFLHVFVLDSVQSSLVMQSRPRLFVSLPYFFLFIHIFYCVHVFILDFIQSPLFFKSSSYSENFAKAFLIKQEHILHFLVFHCLYLRNH